MKDMDRVAAEVAELEEEVASMAEAVDLGMAGDDPLEEKKNQLAEKRKELARMEEE